MTPSPQNVFLEGNIEEKLKYLELNVDAALAGTAHFIPKTPARGPATTLPPNVHPPKKGLSVPEGRARLLHDLASIELQAMELGLRTLFEFPEAPEALREELAELTLSEGRHLRMCLDGLRHLGFEWGHWPVHLALWQAVHSEDTLVDRIFIVHRYLEGSGLDAQETLLRRLDGLADRATHLILKQIHREEIDHVYFGSRWHRSLLSSTKERKKMNFHGHLDQLKSRLPKRIEPICHKWRLQAGFTPDEIEVLENFRLDFTKNFHLK